MSFRVILISTFFLVTSAARVASADVGARQPLRPWKARERVVSLHAYGVTHEVIRHRSQGATYAKFEVEPKSLDRDTLVVFEVRSLNEKGEVPRWRCIAVDDTSDCFEGARRFRWVGSDEAMVLRVRAADRRGPDGDALFAEAIRSRTNTSVAAR